MRKMSQKNLEDYKAAEETAARVDAMVESAELRKDAERYRWFRNHSLQIVHASTGPWVHELDRVIDEAMAEADVFDVPLLCRQRMAAEGLPYPRSSCYSCGQFSPKWSECEARIAGRAHKDPSK
jgi:hypothetical protein